MISTHENISVDVYWDDGVSGLKLLAWSNNTECMVEEKEDLSKMSDLQLLSLLLHVLIHLSVRWPASEKWLT
jgi:hypothetical protein